MSESSPEKRSDSLGIGLALDAYNRWQTMKTIPGTGDEARTDYELRRSQLSDEDRSRLDDKILEAHRPDLAAKEPQQPPQTVTSSEILDILKGALDKPGGEEEGEK